MKKEHWCGDTSPIRRAGCPVTKRLRYIGVGATKFDEMVADRRMPRPKRVDGRVIWDRLKIEAAFTDLPEEKKINPLDRILGDNR